MLPTNMEWSVEWQDSSRRELVVRPYQGFSFSYEFKVTICYTLRTPAMEIVARHQSGGNGQGSFHIPIALLQENTQCADGTASLEIEIISGTPTRTPYLPDLLFHNSLAGIPEPRDMIFSLFKRVPTHASDKLSIGHVCANRELLRSACDYFDACESLHSRLKTLLTQLR